MDRRGLIALRVLLLVGWAAFFFVERGANDTWGSIVVGALFVGSVVNLWLTIKRPSPPTSPAETA